MAANDLTTLANVKQWLGVKTSDDDALLARLITSMSALVLSALSCAIPQATYSERRDGRGGRSMALSNAPITAVSGVNIDGFAVPVSTGPNVSGYYFDDYAVKLRGYVFTRDTGNVVIGYTAGFASIPTDVEQCCIDLVSLRYKERTRIGIASKGVAGETVTYTDKALADRVKSELNSYVRVALP